MKHISEERLFDYIDGLSFLKSEKEHFECCKLCQKNYRMDLSFNQGLKNYISDVNLSVDVSSSVMERIEHEEKDIFGIILSISFYSLIIVSAYFLHHFLSPFHTSFVSSYINSIKEFINSQFHIFQAVTIVSLLLFIERFIKTRKRLNIKIQSHSLSI